MGIPVAAATAAAVATILIFKHRQAQHMLRLFFARRCPSCGKKRESGRLPQGKVLNKINSLFS